MDGLSVLSRQTNQRGCLRGIPFNALAGCPPPEKFRAASAKWTSIRRTSDFWWRCSGNGHRKHLYFTKRPRHTAITPLSQLLIMARTTEDSTCHSPAQRKAILQEFLGKPRSDERLRELAGFLLACECFLGIIQASTPENKCIFVDKVDRVCHSGRPPIVPSPHSLSSTKIYPTLNPQNAEVLAALGDVCRIIDRPPTSAMISEGLQKRENIAVTSGGLTDIWSAEHNCEPVSVKMFRPYPDASMREAKMVHIGRV